MLVLEDGFEILDNFLNNKQLNVIDSELKNIIFPSRVGGIRNAEKKLSSIRELAASEKLTTYAKRYLSGAPCLVRAILFNKTSENNWLVTWHQDKTVAVSEKFEDDEWGPWSIKDQVHHVQPPIEVLNQMITFRIHLDDSNQNNGCLKVLPKSNHPNTAKGFASGI